MLRIAKKLAAKSQHKQHHHAVIITKGGKIVATGYNHKYMHAEGHAIKQLETLEVRRKRLFHGLTMYSFRWRKNGTWGDAKPCKKCQELIQVWGGISTVYYTDWLGQLVKL